MKVDSDISAKTVLVIGADKPFLYVLKNKLAAKGFETDHAYDRSRAVQLLDDNSYDLVLLDLMVDGVDGFTLLHKIRTSKETKVIVLSSLEQAEDREKAQGFGISAFMNKSSTPIPLLISEVEKILVA